MNQPSIEYTTTCAEDLAGNDPKKSMLLEIMDHCGLGYFLSSAIRKVALHQTDNAGVCTMWAKTSEADKAFFIINAPRPNPFYPIQDSYLSFLKGRYSGNIEIMANSEKTHQEALDANLKGEKEETPVTCPVQDVETLDRQPKTVTEPTSEACCCDEACSEPPKRTLARGFTPAPSIADYRPVVESPDGHCAHTLPTLREFLLGNSKDIKQLRDACQQYRKHYSLLTGAMAKSMDMVICKLTDVLEIEKELYEHCREYWDPFTPVAEELVGCPTTIERPKPAFKRSC